jgi:two-component system, OmpR family, sensor kinase
MKARTKITFWTSSFTLIVSIIFSGIVFYEAVEQSFRLIDRELLDARDLTIEQIKSINPSLKKVQLLGGHSFERYWIKVTDDHGSIQLKTMLTDHMDILLKTSDKFYFDREEIAFEKLWIAEEDKHELEEITGTDITFRVLQEKYEINNNTYHLLIARPIPILVQEGKELLFDFIQWGLLCAILVIFVSYYLAGRILRPLSRINVLIKDINDTSLDKRIPVGKTVDELHTLSSSLNKMFDRLQYSFDRQKEFVGNASHELKSPLTILMIGNEKLLSEPLPNSVKMTVERQLNTLRRLSKMVRNLLDISRLEQHESLNREQIDLKPLIAQVIEEFEFVLQEKDIEIKTDLDTTVFHGDRDKILQMLINLLDNAVKYNAPSDGVIWLEAQTVGNTVELVISNAGTTIPKDSLKKIFDQFYRVEKSRSTMLGGAGLGLTIVSKIVEMHDGTISVTSSTEGITKFCIRFPSKI